MTHPTPHDPWGSALGDFLNRITNGPAPTPEPADTPPADPEPPEAFEVELRLNGEVITPQRAHCVACGAPIPGTAAFCLDCEDYAEGDGMGYPFQPEPF